MRRCLVSPQITSINITMFDVSNLFVPKHSQLRVSSRKRKLKLHLRQPTRLASLIHQYEGKKIFSRGILFTEAQGNQQIPHKLFPVIYQLWYLLAQQDLKSPTRLASYWFTNSTSALSIDILGRLLPLMLYTHPNRLLKFFLVLTKRLSCQLLLIAKCAMKEPRARIRALILTHPTHSLTYRG